MDPSQESDASLLWNDTLGLLRQGGMPPATLTMLESCRPISFDGSSLHVGTALSFVQRRVSQQAGTIEGCLEQAAFQPVTLVVDLVQDTDTTPVETGARISSEEAKRIREDEAERTGEREAETREPAAAPVGKRGDSETPGFDNDPEIADSKLTFDRFVAGEENMLAYEAAKQVANGENSRFNPLFIYGKSGLGKTHLLRAIQNYIISNDPSRLCVYRTAAEFIEEYRIAWNDPQLSARSALSRRYQNVDVLIIDDIQNMRTAAGRIRFFFETFNALMDHGKQIVCAADRSPSQLGMGDSKFDERETSRMDSGVTVSVQVPDYELKLNLINAFYDRMRQDAEREHVPNICGTISLENRKLMAERAGTNIRVIEGFVHTCLINAYRKEQKGESLTREDIIKYADAKWPTGQRVITVEQIQKAVEKFYDVSHTDLVGSKRNKELMEPRHVAIWLTRELTDNTLADIGKHFGGRSHATVKHSIAWVDKSKKEDRIFQDRVQTLHDSITDAS